MNKLLQNSCAFFFSITFLVSVVWITGVSSVTAQSYTAQLTGNPVVTTGWTLANGVNNRVVISGDEIYLTPSASGQVGYVYHSDAEQLGDCGRFSVSFEFRINGSSNRTADGLTFFYTANAPGGYVGGGYLGLPVSPDGLVLFIDTYDNNQNNDNPVVGVRRYDGSVMRYTEGAAEGRVTTDLNQQSWVYDGNWHSCLLEYDSGHINVFFDGSVIPSLSAYALLGGRGYFGFTSSTGQNYARHAIRNVVVDWTPYERPPLPVVQSPVHYCQFETASALNATAASALNWYTSATDVTPLATAPVPNTSIAGTQVWYVSQGPWGGCDESLRDSIRVIVTATPDTPSFSYKASYCTGEHPEPFVTGAESVLWYNSDTGTIPLATMPHIVTTDTGRYTWYAAQQINGCIGRRRRIEVKVYAGVQAVYTYSLTLRCDGDTISIQNNSTGGFSWLWRLGDGTESVERDPVHRYAMQGVYMVSLVAYNAEGTCSDSILQIVDTRREIVPLLIAVSPDTIIRYGDQVQLNASGAIYYHWSPASALDRWDAPDPISSTLEPVVYTVRGTDDFGCTGLATVRVQIDYAKTEVLPNAFTPNGDGKNDFFRLIQHSHHKTLNFMVMNRWGDVVYSSSDPGAAWDGSYQGVPQESGTYYYLVQLIYPDGSERVLKGDVLLIR